MNIPYQFLSLNGSWIDDNLEVIELKDYFGIITPKLICSERWIIIEDDTAFYGPIRVSSKFLMLIRSLIVL